MAKPINRELFDFICQSFHSVLERLLLVNQPLCLRVPEVLLTVIRLLFVL